MRFLCVPTHVASVGDLVVTAGRWVRLTDNLDSFGVFLLLLLLRNITTGQRYYATRNRQRKTAVLLYEYCIGFLFIYR